MIDKVIDDLNVKLNENINRDSIVYYNDGHTKSLVFGINKYIIKIFRRKSLENQLIFYKEYKDFKYFPKIITYNKELNYICFNYLGNLKYVDSNIDYNEVIKQIKDIVDNYHPYKSHFYGYLDYKKISWYNFLKYEINHANKSLNGEISLNKVLESLKIIRKYKIEKYLLHGDLGTHNFIVKNNLIYPIDAVPIIGDKLYDFYFAILSNQKILVNTDIDEILNYYDGNLEYKKALFTIVLFIIMGRCNIYNKDNLNIYIKLYEQI